MLACLVQELKQGKTLNVIGLISGLITMSTIAFSKSIWNICKRLVSNNPLYLSYIFKKICNITPLILAVGYNTNQGRHRL